jgi:hypothetical protein
LTCLYVIGILLLVTAGQGDVASAQENARDAVAAADARVREKYGRLNLHFEANRGQTHEDVRFLSRGPGYSVYLTASEAVLVLAAARGDGKRDRRWKKAERGAQEGAAPVVLRMALVDAHPKPHVTGIGELPGKANYFIGRDPAKWRTNIPTYEKVYYREVYPGIDLVYYGDQRRLRYDFVVRAGADPERIALAFQGADRLEIDAQGDLVLHVAGGAIRYQKPVIYQETDGLRQEIRGGYVLTGSNRVRFQVAAYDRKRPLVIDPALVYSTYLGGSGYDYGEAIAVDAAGHAYVTGDAESDDFPTTAGAVQPTRRGIADAFVAKLDPTGSALVYSTYLGGSGDDEGCGIAVDAAGHAYVTGFTGSDDFPTTARAVQPTHGGIADAFVAKLDPTGSALVYSTYLGGSGWNDGHGIAVDAAGHAYVTGFTGSDDFPTTAGAVQPTRRGTGDAFVAKLDPTGSALVYSTYLGGSEESPFFFEDVGRGIAVDAAGHAYVTGLTGSDDFPTTAGAVQPTRRGTGDAFVAKLNPTGSALVYSTYLGGSGWNDGYGIAVDAAGHAYVTGPTESPNFPTTAGAVQPTHRGSGDAFVAKLNPTGSALVYSTYLGGSGYDDGEAIAVDAAGHAYVTGPTESRDFPTTPGAVQPTHGGGYDDAFVAKLNPTGSALVYSTYLGGSRGGLFAEEMGRGIAVDAAGHAYVTGFTGSDDFPTTAGAFQPTRRGRDDAFVTRLDLGSTAPPATTSYYVTSTGNRCTDAGRLRDLGVSVAEKQIGAGPQEGVVILDFFQPTLDVKQKMDGNQTYEFGASLYGGHHPLSYVADLVEAFATGYYNALQHCSVTTTQPCRTTSDCKDGETCVSHPTLHARIVIGTSNYYRGLPADKWFEHGQQWAQMVSQVAAWVRGQGYAAQVDIAGGIDIEAGYNAPAVTKAWVDGYSSVADRYLYNYGSAYFSNGWGAEDIWYVSWGAPPAQPLPQIYNETNAENWVKISQSPRGHMIMAGALTQYAACTNRAGVSRRGDQFQCDCGTCDPTCNPECAGHPCEGRCDGCEGPCTLSPNRPEDGWRQLSSALANAKLEQTLPWSTDISWIGEPRRRVCSSYPKCVCSSYPK